MCPGRRLPLPRSQPFQASCLHPENHGEGEEMGRAMSIDVAILPYGSSFLRVSDGSLDSELAFATRVMRESRRTGRLPFGLPFYLRSACRAQSTPALRTHALLPRIPFAPLNSCRLRPPAK